MSANCGGDALPVAGGHEVLREVWIASRSHRLRLVAVLVLGVASSAAGLTVGLALGYLVDEVDAGTADIRTLALCAAILLAGLAVNTIGSAATIVLAARSYNTILAELRERVVERAMSMPQGVVERAGTGDLVSRSSDDVAEVADAAPQVIPVLTTVLFSILVTFAGMVSLDWRYGAVLLVVVPIYVVTVRWYLRTGPRVYRAERAAMSSRAQQIIESQRGYATIKGFDLGARRHRTVLETAWGVATHTLRARTVQNMLLGRVNVAELLGMMVLLVIGFWLIDAGLSTIGTATAAMLFFTRLFGPITQLLFVFDTLQSVAASLARMIGVMTSPSQEEPASDVAGDGVRLRGIGFGYHPDERVLDGVDLQIPPGRRVAVVGVSGAGKSTLAAIVAGIHDPQKGEVRRPRNTAVITQETHVFTGTVRTNLTLAAPDASDEEIHAALVTTSADRLLARMPDGLDTELGTTGFPLTAAQTQHLALARLVLAAPEVAILDEATAEADSADALMLDRAAEVATTGRSALVVAHRLSQAAACDHILVMSAGHVIEEGTHDALVASGGVYHDMWEAWSRGRDHATS